MRSAICVVAVACGALACGGSNAGSNAGYVCAHRVDQSDPLSMWSAVATDTEYCGNISIWGDWASDCGPYHVRTVTHQDIASDSYYYDAVSGELIAVLHRTAMTLNPTTTCTAGPSTFTPPSCPGSGPGQMLQQCDGGAPRD